MNIRTNALTIALLAGLATSSTAIAQNDRSMKKSHTEARHATAHTSSVHADKTSPRFMTLDDLFGNEVRSTDGDSVGSIDDAIVERGSGRIEYLVLSDGGILGFDAERVAVPFDKFEFDARNYRFTLDVPAINYELKSKRQPSGIVPVETSNLGDLSWFEEHDDKWTNDRSVRDPYRDSVRGAEKVELRGTVERVKREEGRDWDEQTVVTLRHRDGSIDTVVLGPSWWMTGMENRPQRGDEIDVHAVSLSRGSADRYLATSITTDGKRHEIRDAKSGLPAWARERADSDLYSNHATAQRLLSIRELDGMDTVFDGKAAGSVEGAVVEARSGRVAMLTVDPDTNFLGIADETKCVPWQAASIGTERVRFDATRDELGECRAMPGDVRDFEDSSVLRPVYDVFGVEPDFDETRAQSDHAWTPRELGDWAKDDSVAQAVRSGKSAEINGKMHDLKRVGVKGIEHEVGAIVIDTAGGNETVLVGPSWYTDGLTLDRYEGEPVRVQVVKSKIGGETRLFASRVWIDGRRDLTLWEDGNPVWDPKTYSN